MTLAHQQDHHLPSCLRECTRSSLYLLLPVERHDSGLLAQPASLDPKNCKTGTNSTVAKTSTVLGVTKTSTDDRAAKTSTVFKFTKPSTNLRVTKSSTDLRAKPSKQHHRIGKYTINGDRVHCSHSDSDLLCPGTALKCWVCPKRPYLVGVLRSKGDLVGLRSSGLAEVCSNRGDLTVVHRNLSELTGVCRNRGDLVGVMPTARSLKRSITQSCLHSIKHPVKRSRTVRLHRDCTAQSFPRCLHFKLVDHEALIQVSLTPVVTKVSLAACTSSSWITRLLYR